MMSYGWLAFLCAARGGRDGVLGTPSPLSEAGSIANEEALRL